MKGYIVFSVITGFFLGLSVALPIEEPKIKVVKIDEVSGTGLIRVCKERDKDEKMATDSDQCIW
ncbi:hypothetical protein B0O99DRAFT_684607 [Bisporella sp. PMI_857]|nr:hypothetical protein B0O99DRAFT_684607 [Bisporella sp. PMI_857]